MVAQASEEPHKLEQIYMKMSINGRSESIWVDTYELHTLHRDQRGASQYAISEYHCTLYLSVDVPSTIYLV